MFCKVSNGGFFFDSRLGCSPDGLVGSNGAIEIKSADAHIHYDRMVSASFDKTYKWQLICNMKFPSLEWIDFVSYCSDFPEEKRLYIYRLWAAEFEKEFKMVDTRLMEFMALVDEAEVRVRESECIYA